MNPADNDRARRSRRPLLLVAAAALALGACGGGGYGGGMSASNNGFTSPTIVMQPASANVTAGSTATFMVQASGTGPLAYQWLRNGAAVSGATGASYTTPPTTASDNGASFAVRVSNGYGSVTSSPAMLNVM